MASDATEPISPAPTPTDPALPAPPPPTDPPGDAVTVRDTAELVAALSVARPGTRIQLADGVYSAKNSFTVSTACTAADPCALRGSRAAVLDGDGISGHYGLHLIGASHWTLEGFTVANASKGIMLDGSSRNVIDGVEVRDIGDEAIHLRGFSSDNVVRDNLVRDTGKRVPGYGEGIYVGSAKSNWDRYSGGQPDASDRNVVTGNTIWATGAESVDIKEGTTGGTLSGNSFDGAGMSGENFADSWVDVKGNGWLIEDNTGVDAPLDGFQTHVLLAGWGQRNVFRTNVAQVDSTGYGFRIHQPGSTGNVVDCDNVVSGADAGTANQPCST